ncbi:MAG TPA: hypothetical protein VK859_17065 [bacterium]|nr:hypothetical protein [bacterium]
MINNQKGMGFVEMILWAGFIALIGWAAWQFCLHPENLQSRTVSHNAYEDAQPTP